MAAVAALAAVADLAVAGAPLDPTAPASFCASNPNRARLAIVFLISPSASASSVANWSVERDLTSIRMTAWPA